ncbi:tether containing UBX domain for GLUT4 [Aplochiton taeniatus]
MAASGTSVTVLSPNGRRQTVKVSPNTVLLQVLEDVCKKQGFNPEDHGLKFQRSVLDLSLQLRFANLPNNAKLEVVPSTRKHAGADSTVRIALQMEDGSRLQGSFSSGQTLWELLTHFPQTRASELPEADSTPVCVYMRDEVCGEEALKKATLKSLGLTGGSAIVRFILKKTKTAGGEEDGESMETVAVETAPDHNRREAESRPPPRPDPCPSQPQALAPGVPVKHNSAKTPAELLPAPAPAPPSPGATNSLPVRQEGETFPNPQNDVRPKSSLTGGQKQEGDREKAGPSGENSSSSSSPPSRPFIAFSGGGQRLGGPGGTGAGPSSSSSSLSAAGPPLAKKAKSSHDSHGKRHASAKQEEDWDVPQEDEALEPVEREPLIYHLDSGPRGCRSSQDLPDEFFEVTVDDIRKRFAQLKSERRGLEEAPLITKALREVHMKEKIDRYPKVVLRVQFPDRQVIQGFFRPLETVAALRHFVKTHLEDPESSFYLFIAPPKTILEDSTATLFQANLFPAALVYFGSDVKTDCYLQRGLLDSSVSALQADEAIAGCMPRSPGSASSCMVSEDPLSPPEPPMGTRGPGEEDQEPSANAQAPKPVRTDPGKVPKWLKLPGKK